MPNRVQVQALSGRWFDLGVVSGIRIALDSNEVLPYERFVNIDSLYNKYGYADKVENDNSTDSLYKDSYKGSFEAEYNAEFMKNAISNTPTAVPYKESNDVFKKQGDMNLESIKKEYWDASIKPDTTKEDLELIKNSFIKESNAAKDYTNPLSIYNPESTIKYISLGFTVTELPTEEKVVLSQYDIEDQIIQDRDW